MIGQLSVVGQELEDQICLIHCFTSRRPHLPHINGLKNNLSLTDLKFYVSCVLTYYYSPSQKLL